MAVETAEIEKEISKIQRLMNMGDGKIIKALKGLEVLKQNQQVLVIKQKQLQAAKSNISKFNKAG